MPTHLYSFINCKNGGTSFILPEHTLINGAVFETEVNLFSLEVALSIHK